VFSLISRIFDHRSSRDKLGIGVHRLDLLLFILKDGEHFAFLLVA